MILFMLACAKEYIKGINGKIQINLLEDTAKEYARLTKLLKEQVSNITRITGSITPESYLQKHLKNCEFDKQFAAIIPETKELKEEIKQFL